MRSTRSLIHSSLVNCSALDTLCYVLKKLFFRFNVHLCQSVNKNTGFWILSDLQILGL